MKKATQPPFLYHEGAGTSNKRKIACLHVAMLILFLFGGTYLHAQAPQILKDINGLVTNNSQTVTGYNFKGFNGFVYFSAEDGFNGFELWKTDGTQAGTVMVKDINTGSLSSNPTGFTEMNGILFFTATNNTSGTELWKTDGTAAGTVIVKDVYAGVNSAAPQNQLVINGILYFTAITSANGRELWKSDGTNAGTELIKDINAGTPNSTPQSLVNYRDTLYFTAATSVNGRELWKSDGTNAGTVLVKDIYPGASDSYPDELTVSGNFLFFTADDGVANTEIWRTDGSETGTILLNDIEPGIDGSYPAELTAVNNLLVFRAYNGSTGDELWVSDGTTTGTYLLKDLYPGVDDGYPNQLTVIGNTVFFNGSDDVNWSELWKTDGTPAGTVLVKDIAPGLDGSDPSFLRNVNGTLFFTAYTDPEGEELWKSDGTNAGTVLVKDINPGSISASLNRLTNVNGLLYFTAFNGTATVLMKSDGTESGTVALNTSAVSNGTYNSFYGFENKLYFMYNGYKPGIPITATGIEPWVSDGTNAGTTLIMDINPTTNTANPGPYGKAGNTIFFAANDGTSGTELWKTDGTAAGTVLVKDINTGTGSSSPSNFTTVNGTTFFTATVSASGIELWKTDGTTAGTVLVKDIRPGTTGSAPASLTASGNLLYLIANDGTTGAELWKSDGTTAGTVLVSDIVAGTGSPSLTLLTDVNGTLFFTAQVATSGRELWKTDGTTTVLVKDIVVGTGSPGITNLIAYNGNAFFNANDGVNGNEPWVSDGTAAGTTLFLNISTSASFPNSNPTNFTVAGGKLYFSAFTSTTQFEPWVSDGTPGGTYMITEIVPAGGGSTPYGFTFMDDYVYFNANATGTGRELWRTDGTAAGTQLVIDINTGSADGSPEQITAVNSTLFFRATMPGGGVEFYKSDGTAAGTVGYDLFPGSTASTPDYLTALNNKLVFSATHPVLGRELWKIDVVPASNFTVVGDTTPCVGGTAVYSALNVVNDGVTYNWSLPLGGGTITNADTTATVNWTTAGARSVQLVLSNAAGNSAPKTRNLVVSGIPPAEAPVIYNFARTLSCSPRPAGTSVQWFRNDTAILNATDTVYYATLAGNYTAKFINDCGPGPASNMYGFPADVIAQTITFPHTPDQGMAPALKIKLPATASSNLPVFYTRLSGPGTIVQDSLSISGVGTIIVRAEQPGDDVYSAAAPKNDTIIVIKGNQVIDFAIIPDQFYRVNKTIPINPTSSVGLNVAVSIVSGPATVSNNIVRLTGAGNVTVRATQAGNVNYNPATPVDRTFCVGIDTLSAITGATTACLGTYTYTAQKITGANYVWTLSGGGSMVTSNDTAFVTWNAPGTHTLKVKANSSCNAAYSFEPQKSVTINNVTPGPVTNMFPVNNAQNESLPLTLSWIPGNYTETYDLYVWDSAQVQPGVPYKTNITGISYTIPQNAFAYNNAYKWRLVSKNPCNQVSGPIQSFRLVPLPDLEVSAVVAPASAISGQTITISWTVKNNGPGNTPANKIWQDAVYLTFDTLPNFTIAPEVTAVAWSFLNFPVRALLLGTRNNVTALQPGQQYSNSINFTIPLSYSLPVYAYVITNIGNTGIVEVTKINDTARSQNPINITLAPAPDLRIDSMFTPSATFSGSTVNISYKVKNFGSLTPAGASWQDNAYLSQTILFDSATAYKLNAPKANGSYYPNTYPAGVTVNTQLQNDSAYYRSFQAVIPNNIFGTWFLHVRTNNTGSLYEGPSFNNNTNNNAIQVYLTPTPKLTINSLNLPVTQASTTQPIGINWTIYNDGFRDNKEKNRGHYITMATCSAPCSPPRAGCVSTVPSVIKDSIAFGSSFWVDRVYLSMDSAVLNPATAILLNTITHGVQNSGLYPDPNPSYVSCPAVVGGNVNVSHILNPGSNFPKSANFNIPSSLMPGTYYIYVWTNATKTVFEYPGTAEIERSGALIIQRPDAVVSSISSPVNAVSGEQMQIVYSITNNGPGAVFNHIRRDSIYISTSAVFNASAQLIGTNIFTEDLPVGTAVSHSFNYTLHPSQSGTRYFFVRTNIDSAFRETNYANNISAASATIFAPAAPVDFVVTNVQATDTLVTVFASKINYTVSNNGTGTATGTWWDSLYVSCTNVYGQATAYYIGRKQQARSIAAGGNYTDSFTVNIPFTFNINNCFTQVDFNNAWFFVKANANGGVYETANNNNVLGSSIKILDNPLVDHVVTTMTGADSAWVGQPYNLSWTVKNIGRNPDMDYNQADSVFVSVDSILNSNAVYSFRRLWTTKLEQNETKNVVAGFNMINVPTGNYYVFVHTNANKSIGAEKNYSNNVNLLRDEFGAAKTIYITRPLLPDLTDSIISAPLEIALGQPATIIYRVTNNGQAATTGNFMHLIRLANDLNGNSNAAQLSFKIITARLQPGQFFQDTVQVMIPNNITPRVYTLLARADHYTDITESDETNNNDINFITVFRPDSTDLLVMHVTAPDTVMLGYKMDSARWVLKNNSGVSAAGSSSDGVYLSQSYQLDSSATLIGIRTRNLNLAPLDTARMNLAPMVSGVTEGNYNMFVSTDLVNQLPELDESNNAAFSVAQVYVKVKELQLGVVENNTLHTDNRFYKLVIPDSLNGATISVKLTTGDSLTRINQAFIGYGYVPTAAHFDYTYPNANYGNQEIIMAYAYAGTYYIMIRTINPGNVTQNISLLARKLPFEITHVHTNAGGNIGNVTIKISGALFTPGMTAKLNRSGTDIIASAVYFTNTTQVFATFNLQGKPQGIYDVILSKADTAFAVLANGFSVVPANNGGVISGGGNNTGSGNGNEPGCDPGAASGLNSQLQAELLVPAFVMRGWPFVIQINYSNPTNFDLPAQVRTLYAEDIIKMSFTQQGVNNGVHSLTMELTEPGGPPGIIRAGGSGTIFIYCISSNNVPAHTITLFKLQ